MKPGAPRGLGRKSGQRLAHLRDRQQGGDRCGLRGGGACREAAHTSSPASTRNSWSRAARSAPTMPHDERFTLHADVQYPHRVREMLAANIFKIPETQIRVVAGDVGGGFGTKGWQYVEHRLTLVAARSLGRPVKWRCERSEALLADEHGRDVVAEAELALDTRSANSWGCASRTHQQYRRLSLVRPQPARDLRQPRRAGRHLRHSGGLCASDRRVLESARDRALSRRRPARGDLHHRAADRGCGARARARSRRAAPEESHPAIERCRSRRRLGGLNYDCGDFPGIMEMALKLGDAAGFATRRAEVEEARQAARPRHRQCDRARGRARPGIRRVALQHRRPARPC